MWAALLAAGDGLVRADEGLAGCRAALCFRGGREARGKE